MRLPTNILTYSTPPHNLHTIIKHLIIITGTTITLSITTTPSSQVMAVGRLLRL